MAPAPAPAKTGGSGMSKKVGGIPMGALVAGGVVVVGVVYYLRKKNAAAAAAAASTTAANTNAAGAGVATTPYGPAGGGGIGGDTLAAILASQGAGSTGASTAGTSSFVAPTGENQVGSGYTSAQGAQLTDAQGNSYVEIATWPQAQAIQANGGTLYFQPLPGIFQPVTSASSVIPGTALYYQSAKAAAA